MFGKQYNEIQSKAQVDNSMHHANLYEELNDTFTRTDLISLCLQKGIKSQARLIVFRWKSDGAIKEVKKHTYQKVKKS